MAELKEVEVYADDYAVAQSTDTNEFVDYASSHKASRKITRLEITCVMALVALFVAVSFLTIQVSSKVSGLEESIKTVQNQITTTEEKSSELSQEKTELSRASRLKAIADEAGLKTIEQNIRNVDK